MDIWAAHDCGALPACSAARDGQSGQYYDSKRDSIVINSNDYDSIICSINPCNNHCINQCNFNSVRS